MMSLTEDARRLSMVAAEQATVLTKLWLASLRDFLLASAGYSLLASLIPLGCIFCVRQIQYDQAINYVYVEGARFEPPILKNGNVTVVPYTPTIRAAFFVDNVGQIAGSTYVVYIIFCTLTAMVMLFRALVTFQPKLKASVLGFIITISVAVITSIGFILDVQHAAKTGPARNAGTNNTYFFLHVLILPIIFVDISRRLTCPGSFCRKPGQVSVPAQEASHRLQKSERFFRMHHGEVPARRASTVDAKYALQEPHLRPGAGR